MRYAIQTLIFWSTFFLGWLPSKSYSQYYASSFLPHLIRGGNYDKIQAYLFSFDDANSDTLAFLANQLENSTQEAELKFLARYTAARAMFNSGKQRIAKQALLSVLADLGTCKPSDHHLPLTRAVLCTLFLLEDQAGSCQKGLAYVQRYGNYLDAESFSFIYGVSKIELGDPVNGINTLKRELGKIASAGGENNRMLAGYCNAIGEGYIKRFTEEQENDLLDTAAMYFKKASGFAVSNYVTEDYSSELFNLRHARLLTLQGALDEALSLYTAVESHSPGRPPAMWQAICIGRANCFSKLNQPGLAVQWCDSFLRSYEQSFGVKENLLQAYQLLLSNFERLNREKEAIQYMRLVHQTQKELDSHRLVASSMLHAIDLAHWQQRVKKQLEHQYATTNLLGIVLFILFVAAFFGYIFRKRKIEWRLLQPRFTNVVNNEQPVDKSSIEPVDQHQAASISADIEAVALEEEPLRVETTTTETRLPPVDIEEIEAITKMVTVLPDAFVIRVQKGLERFEEARGYIEADLTLAKLARKLKTNTSYLSIYFNHHLHKSFSDYLNELRIQFVLHELKDNPTYKQYTTKAIAEVAGYKNPVTFMHSFKKITGTTLSVYIEKMTG